MSLGDSIVDAERFSDLCDQTLSDLVSSESYIVKTPGEDIHVLSALNTITDEARQNHARAIGRAAQTAIDDIKSLRDTKCQVRNLRDLMHLVRQYQIGLEDITAKSSPETKPANPDTLTQADRDAFETAKTTLKSVIKHAGADKDIAALGRLVNWRPAASERLTFDQLMPHLTDEILRTARAEGKSVSVSYGADDLALDADMYHDLAAVLSDISTDLVETSVETPERRLGLGLGQSAHIAITARDIGNNLDVLLSCEGDACNVPALDNAHAKTLSKYNGKLSQTHNGGLVYVKITGLRAVHTPSKDQRSAVEGKSSERRA